MSSISKADIKCPQCGEALEVTVWDSLNSMLNPEEKERLLVGKLFEVTCAKCTAIHPVIYPMLYHDMQNKVMIQLVLNDENMEAAHRQIEALKNTELMIGIVGNKQIDSYRYRFAKSIKELVEKARIFDCGLDDRVVEIFRARQQELHYENDETKDDKIVNTVFYIRDSQPGFLFFTEKETTYFSPIDMEIYNKFVEVKKDVLDAEEGDFLIVDGEWVYSFFTNINKG
jgi:hypothetical protein